MVSMEWPTATLLVEETKSGSKQFLSQRNVSHLDVGEVGKGIFGGREVVQAADGSLRVGQPVYLKKMDFVSLSKKRGKQP